MPPQETPSPSLLKRFLAVVVLIVATWILLKWVIGLIAGVATIVVIGLAVAAIVWALRTI